LSAQLAEEVAGEHPLDAAQRLALALAASEEAGVVGSRLGVETRAVQRDHVESTVELTIPTTVEAVTSDRSARGLDRARAGKRGEGRLGAHAPRVAARDDQLGRADRSDAALAERRERPHERLDLPSRRLGRSHSKTGSPRPAR